MNNQLQSSTQYTANNPSTQSQYTAVCEIQDNCEEVKFTCRRLGNLLGW